MKIINCLAYIIKKRENYQLLLIPMLFLIFECSVALILNWELFGERYKVSEKTFLTEASVSVHNPLIVIKPIHSDRVTNPFGIEENRGFISFHSPKAAVKAVVYILSLLCSFVGIFIALLWIKTLLGQITTTIRWELWPAACIMAHITFYLIANGNFNNIF
jgi:hypothetical protein